MMRVLVIGNGGREHALAWKLSASPQVERVFVAPGNAGTSLEPGLENLPIAADDTDGLIHAAQTHRVDLTVVGPCLLYTSPSPRDLSTSRMPSSA